MKQINIFDARPAGNRFNTCLYNDIWRDVVITASTFLFVIIVSFSKLSLILMEGSAQVGVIFDYQVTFLSCYFSRRLMNSLVYLVKATLSAQDPLLKELL